ncbi:SCO family protein [Sulfurimonas sp. SAG-AH-194-I05]|nr:SCO family protein [Sulfurimonas sp. SAG-AH-194-I05]MDF1874135.1 SCO family protein [Sulfurimonas sp. SAG-AH-194-I05]
MKKLLLALSLIISFANATTLGIQEKLGDVVPLDLTFLDENGKSVTLKKLMNGKPTILTLNYFRCAGICTPQLNDLAHMLGKLDLAENTDYKVLTVSFAEDETPALAAAKRKNQINAIGRDYIADAWHFVIGENNSSHVLADKVGFTFEKTVTKLGKVDYIHAAALIMISPEGKITRYLNGIEQLPFDVKMALIESSNGTVGPTIAKTLLYCFSYDPEGRTYIFVWEKVAATVMLFIVLAFFISLLRMGRKDDGREIAPRRDVKEEETTEEK